MKASLKKYLSEIGRHGGRASKRKLTAEDARSMVKIREAGRAYRKFHALCFWSYKPDLKISAVDVAWVAEQLKKNGGREAWLVAAKLCR
jgi:hypothetical protein